MRRWLSAVRRGAHTWRGTCVAAHVARAGVDNISTASPPSSVVSPSRPSVGPFTAPLHRCHRTTVLSLGRARHIRPFLCPRAPHPPISLPALLHPLRTPCTLRCTQVRFFCYVFLVLPRPPAEPQPGCLLFCSSFLEASDRLCCRPPPASGGAPGASLVCLADHFFVLRIIRQR